MAYTSKQFFRDLAIYSTGAAVGPKNTAKFAAYAAKKGIQLAGVGAARAAPVVASTAAANPFVAGTALGLGALATPPGQALLDAAAVRGAADRIAVQQAVDEAVFRATELPARQLQTAVASPVFKPAVKRKVSNYSKAVKAGMKAVKASKFNGKKGVISNAKTTFAKVNKVASAVNKGKKVASKGVTGVIKRAVGRFL
tara:strand:+ start:1334 stop:1927 length:594 start_codon:yes stop_codon:yes gene_type:complete